MGRFTGGDPSLLRRINSAVVLHALRDAETPSLTELMRVTGLSRPTVEGVIEGLAESGLVVEVPPDPADARKQGRPARRFRFHAEAGHLLGIEVGAHQVRAVLSDLSGTPLGSHRHDVDESASAEERLERVRGTVAEHWQGAAVGTDDAVFVLAGLSPGAGSLIGGRLHRGFGGAAGEIGALHLLGREVTPEHLLSTTGTPLHPLDEGAVARVFALAKEGDPQALEAVNRFLRRLVHDVAALVLAIDPELVVVGGWAAGLDGVLEPLREQLALYCLRPPEVALSVLGEGVIATGALRLALDHVEEQLFAVEQAPLARR